MKINIKTQQEKPVHEENYNLDTGPLDTSSEQELSMSKKFTCHHCYEVFASERNVELHIEFYHDGEKPPKCLKSDFSCLQKEVLSTHITSVHDDTSLDIHCVAKV